MSYLYPFLLLLGTLLRFIGINQSLWLDEAISANVASRFSYTHIITQFSPNDFHPPFYYLFLKAWSSIFGTNELSLRFPSIIFSLLTALILYRLVYSLYNSKTAFWSSLLFYFNPLIVYYSQEARMYSLLVLLCVTTFYFFVHRRLFLFNFFVLLSLFTHYGSIFYLAPIYLYLLYKKEYRFFFIATIPLFVFALVDGPLLFTQLRNSRLQMSQVPNWSSVLGRLDLKNLLLIPLKFAVGRISFNPKIVYWLVSLFWLSILAFAILKPLVKHLRLSYFFISPIVLASLFSLITGGGLQYFRLLFLIPCFALLIALTKVKWRFTRPAILAVFMVFTLAYLCFPRFYREDWKSLTSAIPRDATVIMVSSFGDPVTYYRHDLQVVDIRHIPSTLKSPFYLIPYGETIHGVDHLRYLNDHHLVSTHNFRSLSLEIWQ